ncbi:hypothetical protein MATL_G00103420 [Megalops atlanticus]|uniref:Uncharacterized protein n=1 Tax=Megalops atlanticus TaxID=7932 RepID=A0A9D3T650_MEGAT|nr:hypothetical protein MATL_G00103420 [Megalops atlanticus]
MRSTDMPGEELRQRKGGGRSKKSKAKGKSRQGGSASERLVGGPDGQEVPPSPEPSLVPPQKKGVEEKPKAAKAKIEEESFAAICLQVLFPYLLAGMGMVMAGMVLDSVQLPGPDGTPFPGRRLAASGRRESGGLPPARRLPHHPLPPPAPPSNVTLPAGARTGAADPLHRAGIALTSGKKMGDRPESGAGDQKQAATKSKFGASLMSLCRRTWMLLRAGGRKGFERSPSAARLVASEV